MDSSAFTAQHHLSSSLVWESMQTAIKVYFFLSFLHHSAENQKISLKNCTYEIRWITGNMNNRRTQVLTNLAQSNYWRLQQGSCSLPNTFNHISLASSQISLQESFQSHEPIKTNLVSRWWWTCPLTNLIICFLALRRPRSDSFRFIHTFSAFC